MGSFEKAINPKTKNFRGFKKFVQSELFKNKDQNIALFCTGGIRCEKAAVLLGRFGFDQVIQLDGGILNYMKQNLPNSKWKGKCFVFDDRITID